MKKNSFVEGTFIATFAIILVKVLGMLYVIPFYKIIGEDGGALYSYAYTVYNLFLNISTAGIPIAVSKIISEYNTLKMYEAKNKSYRVGRNLILIISLIAFFLLFVFAEGFASLILGNIEGGNTLKEVGFVIRCVSFCLLIIPFLSVSKGYLQGHKYITPTSISEVLEQLIRISVILMGSYIVINIFHESVSLGVGVAVLGAFVGGLVSYIYLKVKINKNKEIFLSKDDVKHEEVSSKEIIKKIASYAIPLIIVSVATDIYGLTDMTLVVRTSYKLGYSANESEAIASIISTWAPKICMIINAIAIGLTTSLIPHMVSSITKKDMVDANKKFCQAISIIVFVAVPLTIGLSILSSPIYTFFYGVSINGSNILKYTAFSSFFASIYIVISMSLQSLNKFKTVYLSTILGFLTNAILDIPLMIWFHSLKLEAFYGAILATILGYLVSYTIAFSKLKSELGFDYKDIIKNIKKILIPTTLMTIVLLILSLFLNVNVTGTINIILVCVVYAFVGGTIYIFTSYKLGIFEDVLGTNYVRMILKKIKIKK